MTAKRRKRFLRSLGVVSVLCLAAWVLPSYFGANRFRRKLEAGLEQTLHRSATFGRASFQLLPWPGFILNNVTIREDPAFGSETFARIDRVECDLRWRSLWRRRLEFSRLRLERPTFNIVRNGRGEWNLENLLVQSGLAGPSSQPAALHPQGAFNIDADDTRLNFKFGADKKPFSIVDSRIVLNIDQRARRLRFNFKGSPVRSDMTLPTPGPLELAGEWKPGSDFGGLLDANLRTRDALLYNWVPLLSSHNPDIYGMVDADLKLSGSLRDIRVEGDVSITQLHRWELPPPTDSTPLRITVLGDFNRNQKRALIESCNLSFGGARLHVAGAVDGIPESLQLDLVAALERTQLGDVQVLSRRFWRYSPDLAIAGRVDGLMSVQGPWLERRYGGFVSARDVRLTTPSGSYPTSELAVRIDKTGAHLAPAKISVAPRIDLIAEATLFPSVRGRRAEETKLPPRYEFKFSTKSVELREILKFMRGLGVSAAERLDARGATAVAVQISGTAWPPSQPVLDASADLRAARLLVPGLTEPLNIPRARLQYTEGRLIIEPFTAVLGTSVFTGRLEHRGSREFPWLFDVKANSLSIDQGAMWFDALGHGSPLALIERIPGLRSLAARRSVAAALFTALRARGRFSTPTLTYRSLALQGFRASVDLSGRVLSLTDASFRAGGGRGRGDLEVNLIESPAKVTGQTAISAVKVASLAAVLPPALRKARGGVSGSVRFETRGLSRGELSDALRADGNLRLDHVSLGEFDPIMSITRLNAGGQVAPPRGEMTIHSAEGKFTVRDRRIFLADQTVDVDGAGITLTGSWGFDGTLDFDCVADMLHSNRQWTISGLGAATPERYVRAHVSGSFDQLTVGAERTAAQARRQETRGEF